MKISTPRLAEVGAHPWQLKNDCDTILGSFINVYFSSVENIEMYRPTLSNKVRGL